MSFTVVEAVERILAFEHDNCEDLMQYEVNGIHLYPVARTLTYLGIEYQMIGAERPHGSISDVRNRAAQVVSSVIRGAIPRNPFLISRSSADVLVLASCVGRRITRGGRHFHVIFDYLLPMIGCSSLMLEYPFLGRHRSPEASERVAYADTLHVWSWLTSSRYARNRCITSFVQVLAERLESALEGVFLDQQSLVKRIGRHLAYHELFSLLIKRIEPSVVFMEAACYGGLNTALIKTCRRIGSTVVEYQHGVLNRYHLAYNYRLTSAVLAEYQQYLPDHFLTYGRSWSDLLERLPVPTTVIGNPYLSDVMDRRAAKRSGSEDEKRRILIVSQGECTSVLVELAMELRELASPDYEIIYKLHPSEVPLVSRYDRLVGIDGVLVERGSDIYACIEAARHVVGVSSTVLFEALPFGVPVHILSCGLSDAYIPQGFGLRFESTWSLWENIQTADSGKSELELSDLTERYWEMEWQCRFEQFLKRLGLKTRTDRKSKRS